MSEKKKLIDLSYHNDPDDGIDFQKIAGSGIDGVILREGYRQTIDKKFLKFVEECRKHNLRIYGVYHFLYPLTSQQAIEESINCISNIKLADLDPSTIIVFADYEYDTIKNAAKNGMTLTKEDCNVFTEAFCAGITNFGYHAGIYTNIDFYKNYYIDAVKSKYPIWLADYNGDLDFPCLIHQYSSIGYVPGIKTNVDMNWLFEETSDDHTTPVDMPQALQVIELAQSWLGKNEWDGSYKEIIDIYNSYSGGLPRGLKMQYGWSWCACTWSALAIKLGLTDIMPIEISCGQLVERAKIMNCWVEDDAYVPSPGDAVLYDWQDKSGNKDNLGWPDHVGLVDYVNEGSGYFTTIEGNYNDEVKKRTVIINSRYIRGFIHPKYKGITTIVTNPIKPNKSIGDVAHEVIAGQWDSGSKRVDLLTEAGYSYELVQACVNHILNSSAELINLPNVDLNQPYNQVKLADSRPVSYDQVRSGCYVTTSALYMRHGAGTNKKAICTIPEGATVASNGYYSMFNEVPWLYVNFIMNGIYYGGFASSKYLIKKQTVS